MSSSDTFPPAVPLDIALANIYNSQGETVLEVDVAVKLLQTIVDNNGLGKFRSVNAAKVLPRIANNDNLALFYVLRHAGFYKEHDRLVCPDVIAVQTINNVLQQLIKIVGYNAKIRSGEIRPTTPKLSQPNSPQHHTPAQQQEQEQPLSSQPTMIDTPAPQQPEQQTSTISAPTMTDERAPPSPQRETSDSTATEPSTKSYSTAKSVNQMTAEEKKAYVAQLMASKKKK